MNINFEELERELLAEMKRSCEENGTSYEDALWEMEQMANEPPPTSKSLKAVVEFLDRLLRREDLSEASRRMHEGTRRKAVAEYEEALREGR